MPEPHKGMESVEAVVVEETNGHWNLRDVLLDTTDLGPFEVVVDIKGSGLCHSDLSFMNGTIPQPFPIIVGHEGAGVVRLVGSSVQRCKPGDHILTCWAYCRQCLACRQGYPVRCAKWDQYNSTGKRVTKRPVFLEKDSSTVITGACLGQSSFARSTIVDESSVIRIDSDIPVVDLAPMACGLITGAGSVTNVLKPQPGATVAVFGFGTVGAGALMAALLYPTSEVIAVDLVPSRLALAKELGATATINAKEENVVERLKALTHGRGVDYAIDCTGVVAVLKQAYDSLNNGGTVVVIGIPPVTQDFSFNVISHIRFGKKIIGCIEGDCDPELLIPILVRLHEQGRFPFERLCKKYSFKDVNAAVEDMKSGKVIKPIREHAK